MNLEMIYVHNQTVVTMDEYRQNVATKYGYNTDDIINQNVIISLDFEQIIFATTISFIYVDVHINHLYINGAFGNIILYFLATTHDIDINQLYVNNENDTNIYNPNDLTADTVLYLGII